MNQKLGADPAAMTCAMVNSIYSLVGRDTSQTSVGPPLLGAMLRHARRRVIRDVFSALARAGMDDLREPHMAVLQYPGPDGVSPLELARRSEMSKQAMNQLLGTLERAGYLMRKPHPDHGRLRVVELSARGRRAIKVIREAVVEIEREYARKLGAERYETLVECLRQIAAE
jgi:DNA-binding MarR family transcriptional regulator